ncbi:MAG: DUF423 domain-containing protein [Candidatus Krumholzibacteriia bacterium]
MGRIGAVLGFLAVALGAFGAHGLKDRLPADLMAIFETGVRYHLAHALAMFAAAWARERGGGRAAHLAGWGFGLGTLVFSGSLYLLAVTGARWLGAVTPVGGVMLLGGWVALAVACGRR